jgi:hypothetical protein
MCSSLFLHDLAVQSGRDSRVELTAAKSSYRCPLFPVTIQRLLGVYDWVGQSFSDLLGGSSGATLFPTPITMSTWI